MYIACIVHVHVIPLRLRYEQVWVSKTFGHTFGEIRWSNSVRTLRILQAVPALCHAAKWTKNDELRDQSVWHSATLLAIAGPANRLQYCSTLFANRLQYCTTLFANRLQYCSTLFANRLQYCSTLFSNRLQYCSTLSANRLQYCSTLLANRLQNCSTLFANRLQYCSTLFCKQVTVLQYIAFRYVHYLTAQSVWIFGFESELVSGYCSIASHQAFHIP